MGLLLRDRVKVRVKVRVMARLVLRLWLTMLYIKAEDRGHG